MLQAPRHIARAARQAVGPQAASFATLYRTGSRRPLPQEDEMQQAAKLNGCAALGDVTGVEKVSAHTGHAQSPASAGPGRRWATLHACGSCRVPCLQRIDCGAHPRCDPLSHALRGGTTLHLLPQKPSPAFRPPHHPRGRAHHNHHAAQYTHPPIHACTPHTFARVHTFTYPNSVPLFIPAHQQQQQHCLSLSALNPITPITPINPSPPSPR